MTPTEMIAAELVEAVRPRGSSFNAADTATIAARFTVVTVSRPDPRGSAFAPIDEQVVRPIGDGGRVRLHHDRRPYSTIEHLEDIALTATAGDPVARILRTTPGFMQSTPPNVR